MFFCYGFYILSKVVAHNFGYTLLTLSLGRSSHFVALYRCVSFWCMLRFEKHYGKMANGSLCVTRAMQHELA
ncbi:UDP-glycosyltransferase TURAN [Camellia lanceoleosa]|uniref:UDP-glycosyltransferase TURAN n=1 Tax=Camellia lanceoleosa TaxID=1840588 RepID=A0ACC0H307_9ERIC|nr:UDP-glycosyltransferase TURAN [Camellia lanceoleosa]